MPAKKSVLIAFAGLAYLGIGLTHQACQKDDGSAVTAPDSLSAWRPGLLNFRVPGGNQPLAFDHKAHIEAEEMECLDCHRFADRGTYATLPRLKDCADCHSEPQGEHPDEPKVREYLEDEKEIPWITMNKLPGHVYFSHRAHVAFGEMKCWDCHNDMRKVSATVVKPDIGHLSMRACMDCHEKKNALNECSACHK